MNTQPRLPISSVLFFVAAALAPFALVALGLHAPGWGWREYLELAGAVLSLVFGAVMITRHVLAILESRRFPECPDCGERHPPQARHARQRPPCRHVYHCPDCGSPIHGDPRAHGAFGSPYRGPVAEAVPIDGIVLEGAHYQCGTLSPVALERLLPRIREQFAGTAVAIWEMRLTYDDGTGPRPLLIVQSIAKDPGQIPTRILVSPQDFLADLQNATAMPRNGTVPGRSGAPR